MKKYALSFILLAIITRGEAESDEPALVFKKVMPDGRTVVVDKTTRMEHHDTNKAEQQNLPSGFIAIAGGFRIDLYTMKIQSGKGTETIVWKKELKCLDIAAQKGYSDELKVHAIVEKKDQFAILFTAYSTDVEIIGKNAKDGYEVRSKQSLFMQSSQKAIISAELSWLDEIYALIVCSPGGTEIWRVSNEAAGKIFQDK